MKLVLAAVLITGILIAAAQAQVWIMTNGWAGGGKASHVAPPTCDLSGTCILPGAGGLL